TENRLPLYAQREKSFLSEKIVESVDFHLLGKQIAKELLDRDYSVFDSEDYTIKSEKEKKVKESPAETLFPLDEIIDRLSEEDLSEFTLDKWMSIYKLAKEKRSLKEERTSTAFEEQRNNQKSLHKIPYTNIEVSLGVPWISTEIISQFAIDVLKVHQQYYYKYDSFTKTHYPDKKIPIVQYEKITGYYHVEKYKNCYHKELLSIYGTKRFNAMQILECTLNLRQIKIHDGNVYNEMETLSAIEKQKNMQEAFKRWIWEDEDRRFEVEEAYNNLFGEYETVECDGSGIEFAGMNPDINLFDYQKNAVQKIISTKNTLLSFDVGAGKTYIMIASAMEMRKMGLSRKNMFVVPNNIVGQWEKMFTDLYPKAKVLTVEPKSFTPEKRSKVLSQIKKEDYDGIIIAYSCFDMIPISTEYLLDDMNDTIRSFEGRIAELRGMIFPNAQRSIQNEIEYIKKTVDDLTDCISGKSGITFNDLDINTLYVDEAHNFKNIPLRTSMKNVRGINVKGSKKCFEMMKKVHIVQENNGGRGTVFATGTPLCNSISDTYAMQCYLQYDELKEKGLDRFDNWIKTFARPEEVCEIDVDTSNFRVVTRFKEFFNLAELSKMFGQISIFYNVDKDGLPKLLGYTDIVIKKSGALDEYMKELYERTVAVR
ncbi:MAG: DEAD/DEAH box helicase family protein, partial [Clostridia bacterium]|nr:DEAD/DEAH box helicase family protein [Clostridia bacterium]